MTDREMIRNRIRLLENPVPSSVRIGIFLTQNVKEVSSKILKLDLEGEGHKPSPPYIPPQPPQGGQNFDPSNPTILVLDDTRDFTLR
jgi:hypothetical protein